jgi:hypothetical protein
VGPVVDPVSRGGEPLAGGDGGGMADHGDQVAVAAGLDPEHAKAVLAVVEGDALDEASEDLVESGGGVGEAVMPRGYNGGAAMTRVRGKEARTIPTFRGFPSPNLCPRRAWGWFRYSLLHDRQQNQEILQTLSFRASAATLPMSGQLLRAEAACQAGPFDTVEGHVPFNFRQVLRKTAGTSLQAYLEKTLPDLVEAIDWNVNEGKLIEQIEAALDDLSGDQVAPIFDALERVHTLSDEYGHEAIRNIVVDDEDMLSTIAKLENGEQRALWLLLQDPMCFQKAEDIRFFDYNIPRRFGRRFKCEQEFDIPREQEAQDAFGKALASFFKKHDGSGRSFDVEVIDRNRDGTVQTNVYIEGLPSSSIEFEDTGRRRRRSRPALEAAIVYDKENGILEIVAKGGKPVHNAICELFAQTMAGCELEVEVLPPLPFDLERLKHDVELPTDPEDGIEKARVRRLKLGPTNGAGMLVIEAPAKNAEFNAVGLARRWFADRNPLRGSFTVLEAAISLHFWPIGDRKPRIIHIELGKLGTSNLKELKQEDRHLAEKYLKQWHLVATT